MPAIDMEDARVKCPRPQLAARRIAVGHTQESLAEVLGVSPSTTARWEQGTTSPRAWQRRKLADKLEVTLDQLDRLIRGINGQGITTPDHPSQLSQEPGHVCDFFGTGPVTIAIPLRQTAERILPVISSEDALAARRLTELLTSMSIGAGELRIPPHGIWEPPVGDLVAICGPKSSPVTAGALASDPYLAFEPDAGGRWVIRRRDTPFAPFTSPMDTDGAGTTLSDVAYIGRVALQDRTLLVIAGIHALGSIGAVDYLTQNVADLHRRVGTNRFSMVVRSEHDGEAVITSEAVCPPCIHP